MRFWHHGGGAPESHEPAGGAVGELAQEMILLEPSPSLFREEQGRLQAQSGEEWQEASVVRLFPLTEPEDWLAVVGKDNKEIGVIERLSDWPPESAAMVREALRRRYRVPQIRRVLSCRERFDLAEWAVETDRGAATFLTRHLRDHIQEPYPGRYTLTDVEGNRYDIPSLPSLDPESRRLLEERL
ncbi:MAG: DUF1854 domain-containing protein [Armatimonadetes bacterium]|nr:DUF1854 domain-containing protein [Armatimonadota bacterium]